MIQIGGIIDLLIELFKNMAVVIVLAYILTRTKTYAAVMSEKKATVRQKLILILIFGIFSIYGTLSGIDIMGAIANIRDLGPAIAGLIGGPLVGLGAGLIGGVHRYFVGGITYIPCSISTVLSGVVGGLIYHIKKGKFISIPAAVLFMALFEVFHMSLALVIVKPFSTILPIIESICLPMIFSNAFGMGLFAFIVHNLMRERETQKTKEMIEGELNAAREIQMSIVPKIFPAFPQHPEFDIHAILEPAKEVGGDLYDFFLLDDDHLCIVIGDVSGKGVPASLFMAVTKTLIKAKADISKQPDEVLCQVNSELCKDNDSGMFVTVFLCILTISTGQITFSNGGHNLPILLKKNGKIEVLPKITGMALGVMEDASYHRAEAAISAGDSLLLYTDGVTEAMDPSGELLSDQRLLDILRSFKGTTAKEEVLHILESTQHFVNGANQSDDITILALRYLGARSAEYRVRNSLSEITKLAAAVESFASVNELPKDAIFQLNLSLDELLTNIISYGFPEGEEHEISVKLSIDSDGLIIEIRDDGIPFDPLGQAEPDLRQGMEDRPVGGLGIHLVRKMMDEAGYRRENGHNVMIMRKNIARENI